MFSTTDIPLLKLRRKKFSYTGETDFLVFVVQLGGVLDGVGVHSVSLYSKLTTGFEVTYLDLEYRHVGRAVKTQS